MEMKKIAGNSINENKGLIAGSSQSQSKGLSSQRKIIKDKQKRAIGWLSSLCFVRSQSATLHKHQASNNKGFVFTLDAVLALILMVSVFSIAVYTTQSTESPMQSYEQLHYTASDAMETLSRTGAIDEIGSWWASGNCTSAGDNANCTYAGIVAQNSLTDIIPPNIGFRLLYGNNTIYGSSSERPSRDSSNNIAIASRVASGLTVGKPIKGYMARAWLTKIKEKNNTLVVMGDVITSSVRKPSRGNNLNKVNISYLFTLPQDSSVLDAYWFIETAWWDNKFKAYMNGQYIPGSDGQGNKKLENIESYIHPGNNTGTVESRFGSNGNEGGDDGATHIVIVYNTSEMQTYEFPNRYYFQSVTSNTSIKYKKPIFIVGNISTLALRVDVGTPTQVSRINSTFVFRDKSAYLGLKVPSSGVVSWTDSEIKTALNSNGIYYENLKDSYFWFIVDIDEYHSRENFGRGRTIIGERSYIEVNYTTPALPYASIDFTREFPVQSYSEYAGIGSFYRKILYNTTIPSFSLPLSALWQYAWLYQSGTNPNQKFAANRIVLYHHNSSAGSDPLIIEFARFGYTPSVAPGALINRTNILEANFTSGYAIDPLNSIGTITYLVKGLVGYGDVFYNETPAVEDAISRLSNMMQQYGITGTEFRNETAFSSGVPSLWGPARFTLEVWQ